LGQFLKAEGQPAQASGYLAKRMATAGSLRVGHWQPLDRVKADVDICSPRLDCQLKLWSSGVACLFHSPADDAVVSTTDIRSRAPPPASRPGADEEPPDLENAVDADAGDRLPAF
jgi:hypothetical protein